MQKKSKQKFDSICLSFQTLDTSCKITIHLEIGESYC